MSFGKVVPFRSAVRSQDRSPVRSTPLPILSIGRDRQILRVREQVITSRAGVGVLSLTADEAEPWTRNSEPHLWLFCHTIELPRLVALACRVRRFSAGSRLAVLEGSQHLSFEASLFHRVIRPTEGVERILDTICSLAKNM